MRKLLFDAVSDAVSPESHTILSTELLLKGDYIRSGDNLIIKGKMGEEVVVEGYFSGESSPILVSPTGAQLSPDIISKLLQKKN
jgi:hypothetical protein